MAVVWKVDSVSGSISCQLWKEMSLQVSPSLK